MSLNAGEYAAALGTPDGAAIAVKVEPLRWYMIKYGEVSDVTANSDASTLNATPVTVPAGSVPGVASLISEPSAMA